MQYDIFGHSGETYVEQFVHKDRPPKNNRERLNTLKLMLAHSQFCISGDHTLEAASHHTRELAAEEEKGEEADERFLLLLSDANFDRYGIRPERLGQILTGGGGSGGSNGGADVNAYAIFVGSLGDQAIR